LRKSIHDNKKIDYYDYYIDLLKRLLFQSRIEHDYDFLKYVKFHLKNKIIEFATSLDSKYDRCRTNAMQIIDTCDIVTLDNRIKLYIETLIQFIKYCEEERYPKNLNYLVYRLPSNTRNRAIIRKELVDCYHNH
jgi:hypothetical protein